MRGLNDKECVTVWLTVALVLITVIVHYTNEINRGLSSAGPKPDQHILYLGVEHVCAHGEISEADYGPDQSLRIPPGATYMSQDWFAGGALHHRHVMFCTGEWDPKPTPAPSVPVSSGPPAPSN